MANGNPSNLPDTGQWVYGGEGEFWAECPNSRCPTRFRTTKYVMPWVAQAELAEHMSVIGCKSDQKYVD